VEGTGKLGAALGGTETEEAELGHRRREAERWAAALAGTLTPTCPPEVMPGPNRAASDMPSDWRPMDSALTPGRRPPGSPAPSTSDAAEAKDSRLSLQIEAGDLGPLELSIDRDPSGVRVLIRVSDPGALSALEPERMALERALEQSGVRVASVRVVSSPTRGTVLAPSRRSTSSSAVGRDGAQDDKRKQTRRGRWIG